MLNCILSVLLSGTLPILYINTEESQPIVSKDNYIEATYYLDASYTEKYESVGTKEEPLTLQIRGRGNWTWTSFEKKPYRLKLNKKAALLGMSSNKHFALLAHADDNRGFLRNTIAFELSRKLGFPFTSEQRPVEVVLNDEYIGLYFLTETIRIDKDRLNIYEQKDEETDSELIKGGWLVEIDNYIDADQISVKMGNNNDLLRITYHSPELLSDNQKQYLINQFTMICSYIFAYGKSQCQWQELIDIDSLVKYYILAEITDHFEAFLGSCYLHKDLGEESKWCFGPIWDFGNAFNEGHVKNKFIYEDAPWPNKLISEIAKFPIFQERVRQLWKIYYPKIYEELLPFIDNFSSEIKTAAAYNYTRWPQYGNADMDKCVRDVKQMLAEKADFLNSQWDMSSYVNTLSTDLEGQPLDYYNLAGKRVDNLSGHGIYIVRSQNRDGHVIKRKIVR